MFKSFLRSGGHDDSLNERALISQRVMEASSYF